MLYQNFFVPMWVNTKDARKRFSKFPNEIAEKKPKIL